MKNGFKLYSSKIKLIWEFNRQEPTVIKMIQVFPASQPMFTKHKQKLPKVTLSPSSIACNLSIFAHSFHFRGQVPLQIGWNHFSMVTTEAALRNLESDGTTEAIHSQAMNTMQTSPSTPGQVSAQCAHCLLVQTPIDFLLHSLKASVSWLARSKCTPKEIIQNIWNVKDTYGTYYKHIS